MCLTPIVSNDYDRECDHNVSIRTRVEGLSVIPNMQFYPSCVQYSYHSLVSLVVFIAEITTR